MRINDISTQMLIKKYSNADKLANTSVAQPVTRRDDKAELSSDAKGWLDAMKAAREADPVNPKKVEEIAEKIAKGNYSVSGQDVAERILGKYR